MRRYSGGFVLLLSMLLVACGTPEDKGTTSASKVMRTSIPNHAGKPLDPDYWYTGVAELTSFQLEQNRYNAVHDGELVMIFVTEDFLTDKQVKNDSYTNPNSVSVLKLNSVRRFTTGLYDYSIMMSVFTRADGSATEKITLSAQDWCGQTFVQLNREGNRYRVQLRSYFESEGDRDFTIEADLLEDEILNLIRINPKLIPTGKVSVLPSLTSLRFSHGEHKAVSAQISHFESSGDSAQAGLMQLVIEYPTGDRTVKISYDPSDHNKIRSVVELRPSAFDGNIRETQVTMTGELNAAYWKMNQTANEQDRREFGLPLY